jgi:hypothetical protein
MGVLTKDKIMNHEVYLNDPDKKLTNNGLWVVSNAVLELKDNYVLFLMFDSNDNYDFTKMFNRDNVIMINSYPRN